MADKKDTPAKINKSILEKYKLSFIWPAPFTQTQFLQQTSCTQRYNSKKNLIYHKGIDIMEPSENKPAVASERGLVIDSSEMDIGNYYGNEVVIDHTPFDKENKIYTVYGHLEENKNLPKIGAVVKKGETIGIIGLSGNGVEDRHLHFEFRSKLNDLGNWSDISDTYDVLDILNPSFYFRDYLKYKGVSAWKIEVNKNNKSIIASFPNNYTENEPIYNIETLSDDNNILKYDSVKLSNLDKGFSKYDLPYIGINSDKDILFDDLINKYGYSRFDFYNTHLFWIISNLDLLVYNKKANIRMTPGPPGQFTNKGYEYSNNILFHNSNKGTDIEVFFPAEILGEGGYNFPKFFIKRMKNETQAFYYDYSEINNDNEKVEGKDIVSYTVLSRTLNFGQTTKYTYETNSDPNRIILSSSNINKIESIIINTNIFGAIIKYNNFEYKTFNYYLDDLTRMINANSSGLAGGSPGEIPELKKKAIFLDSLKSLLHVSQSNKSLDIVYDDIVKKHWIKISDLSALSFPKSELRKLQDIMYKKDINTKYLDEDRLPIQDLFLIGCYDVVKLSKGVFKISNFGQYTTLDNLDNKTISADASIKDINLQSVLINNNIADSSRYNTLYNSQTVKTTVMHIKNTEKTKKSNQTVQPIPSGIKEFINMGKPGFTGGDKAGGAGGTPSKGGSAATAKSTGKNTGITPLGKDKYNKMPEPAKPKTANANPAPKTNNLLGGKNKPGANSWQDMVKGTFCSLAAGAGKGNISGTKATAPQQGEGALAKANTASQPYPALNGMKNAGMSPKPYGAGFQPPTVPNSAMPARKTDGSMGPPAPTSIPSLASASYKPQLPNTNYIPESTPKGNTVKDKIKPDSQPGKPKVTEITIKGENADRYELMARELPSMWERYEKESAQRLI